MKKFKENLSKDLLQLFLIISLVMFYSCQNKNYINYYNKVNEIDSVYRFQKDSLTVIKEYRKLFRKYPPKNQERIQELETFIMLANKHNKSFGGKKTLRKLVSAMAPYQNAYTQYQDLYSKYKLDSIVVKEDIIKWKSNLNRKLVDSFTVAFIRDQQDGRSKKNIFIANDKKNAKLLKWTLENYGFPSINKIGIIGNQDVFMPMDNLLSHMSQTEYFSFFKEEILKSVRYGECPPRFYAIMVDRYNLSRKDMNILYGTYTGSSNEIIDTITIDKNRRSIGLPSLKHTKQITKDFFKKK